MSKNLARIARLTVVLAAAVIVGLAVTLVSALIGHEILVQIYGENLAPIDDTPPMMLAVWTAYLVGGLAALIVAAFGWRRLIAADRPRPPRSRGHGAWSRLRR